MNETIEIFKSLDFIGYPNYSVSNLGNVKSLNYMHTDKEKILKPTKNPKGYLKVHLSNDGKRKYFFVHRLVALAFISNKYNLPQVNHKDENKTNNCVWNLEFCNNLYNVNYGTVQKRRAAKIRNRQDESKPVNQYTKEGVLVGSYPSINEASRQTGSHQSAISQCCKGNYKYSNGFVWRYA